MDVAALRASWARVEALGPEVPELFYALLFTMAPALRDMFPVAMTAQRDRLLRALGHIVSHVDDAPRLVPYLERLGRDHRRFAVRDEHYPVVGRALLATLQRALGPMWTPRLAADWAAAYQAAADIMRDAAARAATTGPPFWDATVTAVQRRCAQVTVLTVVPHQPYPFRPGQALAVEYPRRPRLWRYLSPANAPRADGSLELHVRAVPAGQVSPALAYQCRPGESVRLGAPVGAVPIGSRDLLFIAGGTGLAPLRSIVEGFAGTGDPRSLTLVVGADTEPELYDRPGLAALAAAVSTVDIQLAVARGDPGPYRRGTALDVALRHRNWSAHDIYVCGSPAMVAGTRAGLAAAGYRPERIISGWESWDDASALSGVAR
jgi:NAD(P)H-flavin reductase/hemoglobin-like flavoprotein